jgi:hypothetical protein
MAALRTDIEDHLNSIRAYIRPVGDQLIGLLERGLHHMLVAHEEMTEVVGPMDEVTDAMQAAQDVIDHVSKYGYRD